MASYPSSIYSPTNPSANSPRNQPSLAGEITGLNGEVVAIETALGANLSAVVHPFGVGASVSSPIANQILVATSTNAAQWEYPLAVASVTASVAATTAASVSNAVILANGTFSVTLPTPVNYKGQHIYVKNVGSGSVSVVPHASETIDGASSIGLTTQYEAVEVCTDGTNWFVIGQVATSIL